jgi:tRNA(Arg) A34 adenosine deaminase TadA
MDNHHGSERVVPILPDWVREEVDFVRARSDCATQIGLAIELARRNVVHATGGPFGAAVFDDHGSLIAVGVNRVEPLGSSLAHAEIVALVGAQRKFGRARLNADGHRYTLAASAQPCCQCYGALVWAGVDELLIGARNEDTESIVGFDEGPLPADWTGELERRHIRVMRDLQRDAARQVLAAYAIKDGTRY